MNKKQIQIIITFSFIALLGTAIIQYYWIKKIYQQNHLLFNQNTNNALKYAIQSLDQEENMFYFNGSIPFASNHVNQRITVNANSNSQFFKVTACVSDVNKEKETLTRNIAVSDSEYEDSIFESLVFVNSSPQKRIEIINTDGSVNVLPDSINTNTFVHVSINHDSMAKYLESKSDSLIKLLKYRSIDLEKENKEMEATVEQLVWEMDKFSRPFADNLPIGTIKQVLSKTIEEYQLPQEYEFAIYLDEDSLLYSSEAYSEEYTSFTYEAKLFPYELISRNQFIRIQFQKNPLYIKLFVPISLSLAFTIILFLGFLLIIKNMMHHKNISEMKSDFINNMTHEFKTPIASISLASDSILLPPIINNKEKVEYFAGMIKKENRRMNRLVEKILQMARLENKELELDKAKVDINQIIHTVIENTQMKLGDKGLITFTKNTHLSTILADQDHITSVIYNLIDNAIKYSTIPIEIQIRSSEAKSFFCLSITDNGKGIDKKDLPHIFDRFYRVESGNIHNVKGYGLGLTYTKAIIDKHGGQILVSSEIGKGSTFEIRLPLKVL